MYLIYQFMPRRSISKKTEQQTKEMHTFKNEIWEFNIHLLQQKMQKLYEKYQLLNNIENLTNYVLFDQLIEL